MIGIIPNILIILINEKKFVKNKEEILIIFENFKNL